MYTLPEHMRPKDRHIIGITESGYLEVSPDGTLTWWTIGRTKISVEVKVVGPFEGFDRTLRRVAHLSEEMRGGAGSVYPGNGILWLTPSGEIWWKEIPVVSDKGEEMLTKTNSTGTRSVIYGDNPVTDYCEVILDNSLNLEDHEVQELKSLAEKYKNRS